MVLFTLTLPLYFLHFLTCFLFFLQFLKFVVNLHTPPNESMDSTDEFSLSTRDAHVQLSRFSSISGTDFVSLLDDAIESILDPTETVTARNTGSTITTNDTSSGATSSLSASQSGTAIQSNAFVAYCSNNTELQNVVVPQPPQLLAVQTLVMAVDADGNEIGQRCDQSLDSPFETLSWAIGFTSCLFARAAGHVF